ncbi:MAG: phosphomannomutase [Pseudomonadota bacterium]
MAPKFGTSGLRGLAVELTDELCARYAAAFCGLHENDGRLFIGRDKRESSARIAAAVARGAASSGLRVVDCGVLPTPAMAGAALRAGTISIMVTGSHIPADRNGLKFYTARGEFTKADEAPLIQAVSAVSLSDVEADVDYTDAAAEAYVARYVSGFPDAALKGRRIGVWVHSSTAGDVLPRILEGLGATVMRFGASDMFVPVDTEAVDSDTRATLAAWVKGHALDAIVSTDGDADRPLFMDDSGTLVPGDILGPITAHWAGATEVVTTVSANTLVDLWGVFQSVHRTKIGSPYVIAQMEARMSSRDAKLAGYEPNGGFLTGFDGIVPALMTRDAVLPILAVLAAAEGSVSAHVARLPQRRTATDRLTDVPGEASLKIVDAVRAGDLSVLPEGLGKLDKIDETDGVRLSFSSGKTIHIRPSGNAPELRCYVEASDGADAVSTLRDTLQRLKAAVAG